MRNFLLLAAVLAVFGSITTVSSSVPQVGSLTPLDPFEVSSGLLTAGTVISPDGKHVYGLNTGGYVGSAYGSISQFSRNSTSGALTPLTPFHVNATVYYMGVFDSTGSFLYMPAVNVSIFSRNATTGQLTFLEMASGNLYSGGSVNIWASMSPDDTTLYASGYGVIDVFSRNLVNGSLTLIQEINETIIWAGSDISPDGHYLYVASLAVPPLSGSFENLTAVYQFEILPDHTLAPLTPAYVEGCNNSYTIVVSPDGHNLYLSCSGIIPGDYDNSLDPEIKEYSISDTGGLTFVQSYPSCLGGLMIAMPSDGASLYQNCFLNNSVGQYLRGENGGLTELTPFLVAAGDSPTFGIVFSPDNSFLYVGNSGLVNGSENGTIAAYARIVPSTSSTPSTTSSPQASVSPSVQASNIILPSSNPRTTGITTGSKTGTTGKKRRSTTGSRSITGGTTGVSDAWTSGASLATVLSTVVGLCLVVAF